MPADVGAQFVDSDILLYAYDGAAGERHQKAHALVGRLGRQRRGRLSIQVLQEFYVNATRKIAQPLSPSLARERIAVLGRWLVHRPDVQDVIAAAALAERHQVSFWDAMIVRSAERLRCSVLWSEDLNSGQLFGRVRVRNPFEEEPVDERQ